jgi:hypothetical protein
VFQWPWSLAPGELLPAGRLDGEPPDEKRLTEASGNEGATYERSYHRAVLVLWHRNRTADVMLQAGVVAVLPYLRQLTPSYDGSENAELLASVEVLGDTQAAAVQAAAPCGRMSE